jgi:hypothetical protein
MVYTRYHNLMAEVGTMFRVELVQMKFPADGQVESKSCCTAVDFLVARWQDWFRSGNLALWCQPVAQLAVYTVTDN